MLKIKSFSFQVTLISLVIHLCSILALAQEPVIDLKLTLIEKNWLKEHQTIRVAGPISFPPFHFFEKKEGIKGISADYLFTIMNLLGVKVKVINNLTWSEVLEKAQAKKIDLIPCIAKTADREIYLNFSNPYLSFPLVILSRKEASFIGGVEDLHGKKLAIIKNISTVKWLERDDINFIPYYVTSPLEGLEAVAFGLADAGIENLAAAGYLIQKRGLTNLKIAAPTPYGNYNLYMAVRQDWQELPGIINKVLETIPPEKKSEIRNKWLSTRYEHGLKRTDIIKWVFSIIFCSGIILALVLLWNRRLKKEIFERKQAEEKYRLSEKRFRKIIEDVSGVAIQGYDEERRVTFWNQASQRLYGYTEKEAFGKKLEDLIIPVSMMETVKKAHHGWITLGEKIPSGELDLIDKNKKTVSVYSSHVMQKTGSNKEMFCIDIDLNPIKKAEKEKMLAQKIAGEHEKLALVGKIAGKMAHDFNNILSIIMGTTELSLIDCMDDETRQSFKTILEQTLKGKNLTKNLVAFARDQEPRQEFFNICDTIPFVLNLLKRDLAGIEVIRDDAPDIPDLLADPGMMEHALINIIQNSIHAVSQVEHPVISIRTFCSKENVCFEIKDNGCGIPHEHMDKIYEPSFTLKGSCDVTGSYRTDIKGTGYGLSNIKKYIDQHRGHIFIESEAGSGTVVTICIPVIKRELTPEEKKGIQKENPHTGKHILLIEDEPAISDIQYRILTREPFHHKVDIAETGQSAMKLFEENQYDFISLDYILPGQITGMDVYQHIRKTDKKIPILFISGNITFIESIKELKQKDTNIDHLSKPCQNKEYVICVNKLMEHALKSDTNV